LTNVIVVELNDRWRQVLNEAARIKSKHLLALEPGISDNQTDEMEGNNLQLVVPKSLHSSYSKNRQQWLFCVEDLIKLASERQKVDEINLYQT